MLGTGYAVVLCASGIALDAGRMAVGALVDGLSWLASDAAWVVLTKQRVGLGFDTYVLMD